MSALDPYLPALIAAWSIHLVGAASPGPSVALLLGHAASQGRMRALLCALGIAFGSMCLAIATVAGVSALVAQAGELMAIIRLLGASYLAWLAIGAFRKAVSAKGAPEALDVPAQSARRTFWGGFFLQVSNPKALVFWLAIASVGATAGGPAWLLVFFVCVAFLISLGAHGAWAILLSAGPLRALYVRTRRWVEAALGTFFAYAAFRLATERG